MKYTRTFDKKVEAGQILHLTRPLVPVPITLRALRVSCVQPLIDNSCTIRICDDDKLVFNGHIANGTDLVLESPIRVHAGRHEFRTEVFGLPDVSRLKGELTIIYSLFG